MPTVVLILLVLAIVLEGIAAGWPAPPEPYRGRLIAAGLFSYMLAELLGRSFH